MRKIEAHSYFSVRRINRVAQESTERLSEEQLAAAKKFGWTLDVSARPLTMTLPEKGGPVIEPSTSLGDLGLRGLLTVAEYYPHALREPGPRNRDSEGLIARVDLVINGIVPSLGLRGVLLDAVTVSDDLVFREVPYMYDSGCFRQAGLSVASLPIPPPSVLA